MSQASGVEPPDPTPLKALATSGFLHRVERPSNGRLVIAPARGTRACALVFVAGGGAPWALLFLGIRPDLDLGFLAAYGIALIFLALGVLLLLGPKRHEFDRDLGVYRRSGLLGLESERPLSSIRGVQLIKDIRLDSSGNGQDGPPSFTNQLNLLTDDPRRPRLNLTDQGEREATIRLARDLAAFLRLPLHETTAGGPGKSADREV